MKMIDYLFLIPLYCRLNQSALLYRYILRLTDFILKTQPYFVSITTKDAAIDTTMINSTFTL